MRGIAFILASVVTAAGCMAPVAQLNPVDAGAPVCDGGPWLVATPQTIDFGAVVAFTTVTQSLTVSNCSGEDLVLIPAPTGGPQGELFALDRATGTGFTVPAGGSVPLQIAYAPVAIPDPTGTTADTAWLKLVDVNGGTLQIALRGEPLPSGLAFSPASLDFGILAPGDAKTLALTMTNTGRGSLDVPPPRLRARESLPGFSLAVDSWGGGTLGPGESQQLQIIFAPPETSVVYQSVLIVGSTEVYGLLGLVGQAALDCSPSAFNFGWAKINDSSKPLSLLCTNVGYGDLVLHFSADNPAFSARIDPASLSPASEAQPLKRYESVLIDLVYSPLAPVSDTGTLTLFTAGHSLAIDVALSGQGFTTELGPCFLAVAPEEGIGLGLVKLGTSVDSGFTVTNVGAYECLVDAFDISVSSCSPAFTIPSGVAEQRLSTQGGGDYPNVLTIPVSLAPLDAGLYSCYFDLDLDAGQPPFAAYVWGRGVVH